MDEIYDHLLAVDGRTFLLIDEASTHFDARRNASEVASQFTPLAKRFAKLSTDWGAIGHTVKDIHPAVKRLSTLLFEKEDKTTARRYNSIEDTYFDDPVFDGPLEDVEPTSIGYSPDDWSPLEFDLDPERLSAGL